MKLNGVQIYKKQLACQELHWVIVEPTVKKSNCIVDFNLEVYKKIGNKNLKFYVDCHKSFLGDVSLNVCLEAMQQKQLEEKLV